ncbi:sodium/solute symporter [Mobilicoccus pelagius]|uniref:Sodium/solute symporter family protein n=1 Tax=Mobilicoccus pelagius NBRC 104925 TaxID=1089455 RepID=H5UPA5_9MICO|nr:cation acetate symporter [Mobilicoccus pelagius]GAB47563.1 sodium/solute symporter family protein [Mobilicoccus pelagius NBRC 104925]
MSTAPVVLAIALMCVGTVAGGIHGVRISRTTSDFYVAGRSVTPWRNAFAIGGEYLSAASFLGIAGLVYASGWSMLWFPVGYTLGYVVLAAVVAAPLRRSGAYTLPDFAQLRLQSPRLRLYTSVLVVLIGWLYLVPQLQGADIAVATLTGAPGRVGSALVVVVVTINVVSGGMRSVTDLQAVQYWVKLVAIAVPALVLVALWAGDGHPAPTLPAPPAVSTRAEIYATGSLLLALCLGTMGLPHVAVRFYTNRDGASARRTTVPVVGLLALFYLFPPVYAALGRVYLPGLPAGGQADEIVLLLPRAAAPGPLGETLVVLLAVGAFAAFLSTASGLAVAVTGVVDQDLVRPRLRAWTGDDVDGIVSFRLSAVISLVVPLLITVGLGRVGLATTVGLVFAVSASTLCPLLALGVWWPGLTARGAALGMTAGGIGSLTCTVLVLTGHVPEGTAGLLVTRPAAWSVPLAFVTAVLASYATADHVPRGTQRIMTRLHTPDHPASLPGRHA